MNKIYKLQYAYVHKLLKKKMIIKFISTKTKKETKETKAIIEKIENEKIYLQDLNKMTETKRWSIPIKYYPWIKIEILNNKRILCNDNIEFTNK